MTYNPVRPLPHSWGHKCWNRRQDTLQRLEPTSQLQTLTDHLEQPFWLKKSTRLLSSYFPESLELGEFEFWAPLHWHDRHPWASIITQLGSHVLKSKGEHPPAPGTLVVPVVLLVVEGACVVTAMQNVIYCLVKLWWMTSTLYSHQKISL